MQGPSRPNSESAGMIPRAVQQIYEVTQKLKDRSWTYTMEGQFLEIYNETVHDLLGDTSNYGKVKHEIRHEKNGRTTVTDMSTGEKKKAEIYEKKKGIVPAPYIYVYSSVIGFPGQSEHDASKSKS